MTQGGTDFWENRGENDQLGLKEESEEETIILAAS